MDNLFKNIFLDYGISKNSKILCLGKFPSSWNSNLLSLDYQITFQHQSLKYTAGESKSNFNYIKGDSEELNFATDYFDLVISYQLPLESDFIYWSLQEINRVLKNDGKLLLIFLNPLSFVNLVIFRWLTVQLFNRCINKSKLNLNYLKIFSKWLSADFVSPNYVKTTLESLDYKGTNFYFSSFLANILSKEAKNKLGINLKSKVKKLFDKYCFVESTKSQSIVDPKIDPLFNEKNKFISDVEKKYHSYFAELEHWVLGNSKYKDLPKAEIHQQIKANDAVLVLSPHPDDEIIGCGGTILQLLEQKHPLTILQLTDGSGAKALKYQPAEVNHFARVQEAIDVAKFIGVKDLILWKLEPKDLLENEVNVAKLKDIILSRQPKLIFTPFINDPHIDHIKTNQILARSLKELSIDFSQLKILCYEVWSLVPANCYSIIAQQLAVKNASLLKYRWAMRAGDYIKKCKDLNGYHHLKLFQTPGFAEVFFMIDANSFIDLIKESKFGQQ